MIGTGSLIERGEQIRSLFDAMGPSASRGTVVLISGEAGHGKTSLINNVLGRLDHRHKVLVAACEPLGIPAAFAPLFELLDQLPDELQRDIKNGAGRPAVYSGMLDFVKNDRVVLVLEDMHWADEATLGLVRYLGKRMEATNSCVILTYRSEDLDSSPPLRLVVGDLGPTAVRIDLPPLTRLGVEQMVIGTAIDAMALYLATLGNPFLVEEVVRHPDLDLPPTVQNAVLANASQMPAEALEILYMVALSPDGIALSLAESLNPDAGTYLDLALRRRLILISGERVTCRHELIRESLAQSVPTAMKRRLHRRLLGQLEASGGDPPDITRLAFHSVGAGVAEKALAYSLQAARAAAAAGAHRQAAFHFDNALEHRTQMDPSDSSIALLEAAHEHCSINAFLRATELAGLRLELAVTKADEARARAWLSFFESRANDLEATRQESQLAVAELRNETPSAELALALGVSAWLESVEGSLALAIALADEAETVAKTVGSPSLETYAASVAGLARCVGGDPAGVAQLEKAAKRGTEERLGEFGARALHCLAYVATLDLRIDEARKWHDRTIEYSTANELDAWYIAAVISRANVNLSAGRWAAADRDLEIASGQKTCISSEVEALVTAATLRARRADPGSTEMIEGVLDRVLGSTDLELLGITCVLALEGAWMGFIPEDRVRAQYEELLNSPALATDPPLRGRLAFWAERVGFQPPEGDIPGPAGLELRGETAEAARLWEDCGFPVESAIVQSLTGDANVGAIFSSLRRLGAEGVTRGLRRELLRRGFKNIPRGERTGTRENPAGLTAREAEVLSLVAAGLSNGAIAERLFITEKTAGHHVSAILTKLGVASRVQAATYALAKGWAAPSQVPT